MFAFFKKDNLTLGIDRKNMETNLVIGTDFQPKGRACVYVGLMNLKLEDLKLIRDRLDTAIFAIEFGVKEPWT